MFFNLPESQYKKTFIFSTPGKVSWLIPQDAKFLYILCVGGGGGGGSGAVVRPGGSTINSVGGGGGGGTGGIAVGIFPTLIIPDNLYMEIGQGGDGAPYANSTGIGTNSGTSGTSGNSTIVYIDSSRSDSSRIFQATGGSPGTGGSASITTGAGEGIGGAGGTGSIFLPHGISHGIDGSAGGDGGNSDQAGQDGVYNGSFLSGGGGGGGVNQLPLDFRSKGGVTLMFDSPANQNGFNIPSYFNPSAAGPGIVPSSDIHFNNGNAFRSFGGCGGDAYDDDNPGYGGGDGALGSGGGGGGALDSSVAIGTLRSGGGGKGGNGFVIIKYW